MADPTLSDLLALRTTLRLAMASGTLRMRHGDREVQYRSMTEMIEALGLLDEQIAALDGTKRVHKARLLTKDNW